MAVVTGMTRRAETSGEGAVERNRAEDLRIMQRINAAAAELHRLWSAAWTADVDVGARRRARLSALQAEIDRLYEQRRQLVADRVLIQEAPRRDRTNLRWAPSAALAA